MRIFIVDDEEISCRGLSGMIGRILGKGGDEIHTFTSSVEALEQAKLLRPDVIFLDIIMPELDGMDFTEKIKEVYSPEIIIISGNDDYKFVRRSFKLDVRDYLLKPIEFSELKNFIVKLQNDFKDSAAENELDLNVYPCVFTAVIKSRDDIESFFEELSEMTDEVSSGKVKLVRTREQYDDNVIAFYLSSEADYDCCTALFKTSFKRFSKQCGGVVKAAYSPMFSSSDLESARLSMFDIFCDRLYTEDSEIYCEEDRRESNDNENNEFFQELARLPHFSSFENGDAYRAFVSKWFDSFALAKLPFKTIKREYDTVIARLLNVSKLEDDLEIRNFKEFNTLSEIVFEVRRVTEGVLHYHLELNQNDKNVIELALKYINENYQKNITLATVSNYYNLNYSYFSRIFKDFIGVPFSQYLLKIRMDKAKELLINYPDFKISDIAKLVGYSGDNVQNFTRAFKNYFGKSPKNYKN